MRPIRLLIGIVSAAIYAEAVACDATDLYRTWSVQMAVSVKDESDHVENGRRVIRIRATQGQLNAAPLWDLGEEPPLLPDKARILAMESVRRSGRSVRFEKIHLEPYPCTRQNWFYIVWYSPESRKDLYPLGYFVGVLMDGTVLLPTTEEDPE